MKRRNPNFGCPKIAEQISKTFALPLNKDVVRRILAARYRPEPTNGPSWLTFLGHMKDSLWSMDFFRCESLRLKTHWVLVVVDHCTRRIIGFGVHQVPAIDGIALCRLFLQATSEKGSIVNLTQVWQTGVMKTTTPSYQRHRFPSEIISHAVWLYHRFCLSFREVEELLAERGVTVTYESVRLIFWCSVAAISAPQNVSSAANSKARRANHAGSSPTN
jgi:hypothetical protein